MSASKHKLNNLSVLVDYNKFQSYGPVDEVLKLEPLADKWRSFGFKVKEVNGHDIIALQSVLSELPFNTENPNLIICHTIKGKGFPFAEQNPEWHHKSRLTDEDLKAMRDCISI